MSNKKKETSGGVVYSTNPNYQYSGDNIHSSATIPNDQQKLKILLDTKNRAGKAVTLISGFKGKEEDLEKYENSILDNENQKLYNLEKGRLENINVTSVE